MKRIIFFVSIFICSLMVFGTSMPDWNNTSIELKFSDDGTQLTNVTTKYEYYDDANQGQYDFHNIVFVEKGSPILSKFNSLDEEYHIHVNNFTRYGLSTPQKQWGVVWNNAIYSDEGYQSNGWVELPTWISGTFVFDDLSTLAKLDPNKTYNAFLFCSYTTDPNNPESGGTFWTRIDASGRYSEGIRIADNENYRFSANFHFNGFGGSDFTLPVKKGKSVNDSAKVTNPDYSKWIELQKREVANWPNIVKPLIEEGLKFEGWYLDENFTQLADFDISYDSNYHHENYYAKWILDSNAIATIELNEPQISSSKITTFPQATVSGRVYTMSVSVTGGEINNASALGASFVDLTNSTATFSVASSQAAQTILRTLELKDFCTMTSSVKVTVDGNHTDVPNGVMLSEYNGHYYTFIEGVKSWSEAYNTAKQMSYMGMRGYLATVNNSEEYNVLKKTSTSGKGWLGGTILTYPNDVKLKDEFYITLVKGALLYPGKYSSIVNSNIGTSVVSDYYWACGPEAGIQISSSLSFLSGEPNGSYNSSGWITDNDILKLTKNDNCLILSDNGISDIVEPGKEEELEGFYVEFGGYQEGLDPGNGSSLFKASDSFSYEHIHDWQYSAGGTEIQAQCNVPFCFYNANPATMSIVSNVGLITATVEPKIATNRKVSWISNNPSVVTINDKGYLNSVSVGSATITALAEDESGKKATCLVTVVEF